MSEEVFHSAKVQEGRFPANRSDLREGHVINAPDFIKELLSVTADDARNVLVMASVSIGAVVFLVKDSIAPLQTLDWGFQLVAAIAAVALLLGGILLFRYSTHVNQRRMSICRCLASEDANYAHYLWVKDPKMKRRRTRTLTLGLFFSGVGALTAVVAVGAVLFIGEPIE